MLSKFNPLFFSKSTWLHLRIPYSLCLAPVTFFAFSSTDSFGLIKGFLIFITLHFFLYPASQAYNSFYDQDKKSIGGIKEPPLAKKEVLWASFTFDFFALTLSLFIGKIFFFSLLLCSFISKAYSHPLIRLKKRPWLSWITVAFFQGPFIFFSVFLSLNEGNFLNIHWPSAISTFFLFGGAYPMTQIFQHDEDKKRGDKTLSLILGIKGTFIFSGINFIIGSALLYKYFELKDMPHFFYLFQLFLLPVIIYFLYWFILCFKDKKKANYKNCMRLNILSALSFSLFFIFVQFN